jgi:putative oxidoreductase
MSTFATAFFRNRTTGGRAFISTVFRVLAGLTFLMTGYLKLADLGFTQAGFAAWGFPDTIVIPLLLGLVEFVGALMLLAGLGTRLAALGLGILMIGASIANALFFVVMLPVTIVLFVFMVYLLWAGPGAFAVDNRLAGRFSAGTGQLA